ncbi:MAG: HrcA family transcriptional regulator, partial [Chloroflexota bacterium]
LEERVTQLVLKIMEAEERVLGEVYITGLANLLDQPEFGSRHQLSPLVEAVETQGWLSGIIPDDEGIRVVIGQENQVEALRSCSLVLGRYGIPGGIGGVIGILGPTRMRYGQAISSIRYLKGLLSGLLQEYYA